MMIKKILDHFKGETFDSFSPEHTFSLGQVIGFQLVPTTVVMLNGDLGSGKTTFVKGLADGLGVPNAKYVNSPTYNLINEYTGRFTFYHVDLYRIYHHLELDEIGLFELLSTKSIIAIEWPEKIDPGSLPNKRLDINFGLTEELKRKISMVSHGFSLCTSSLVQLTQN